MDRRLSEAILRGDKSTLLKLIEEDNNKSIIEQSVTETLTTTILHLVARLGHVELAMEIVKVFPQLVVAENKDLETPLHEACREGQMQMIKFLVEANNGSGGSVAYKVNRRGESALFVACENGRLEVVKYLLNYFPVLLMLELDASTTSLHVAASSGHTDIVKELVKARPDFAWKKNVQGHIPFHLACIKGHLDIARQFLRLDDDLSTLTDDDGRTPLHWAAIKDNNGNTILHLATAAKLSNMVVFLLKFGVEVNALNRRGRTALDIVEADGSNSGLLAIVPALTEAGGKRFHELPNLKNHSGNILSSLNIWPTKRLRHSKSPSFSKNQRHNRHRSKQIKLQNEGLRNARKTIAIVAVLVTTVTFTAGLNPPGGFNQETGKATRGKSTAFKVFVICNIVALFLSLGIVNVLLSIIPFRRESMMKLLVGTHKVMWVSTLFMASAYIAGIWTILPTGRGTKWVKIDLVIIGGGSTMVVFMGLGLMLARHWYRKYEWRRQRKEKNKDGSQHSSVSRVGEINRSHSHEYSSNSDVDSSDEHGYHLY
ncbi:scaffold/adaptor protein [Lithospermum erythrorhizon]|uniref:Scaffold/adaptor protein n=1 Tax=Lithospermum erythrorhizon TaxID=34254 RepID=A0AAV3R7F0_LITER